MFYALILNRFGVRSANIAVILTRGLLIALVILLSDKGSSDFTYMNV